MGPVLPMATLAGGFRWCPPRFGVLLRKEVFFLWLGFYSHHTLLREVTSCFVPETTAKAQLVVGLGTKAFSLPVAKAVSLVYMLCHAHLTGSEAFACWVEH